VAGPLDNDLTSSAPLKGTVVIEIGHSVSAPYAGLVLAQLGAEVIKVEHPQGGDPARGWGQPLQDGASPLFHAMNRGKLGVALDLRNRGSRADLVKLIVERADVVIQNLRPNSIEELGLGPAQLTLLKPSLIYCNLSAFGALGPMALSPGYDALMQAYGGLMSVTGEEGRPAVRVGVSIVDIGAGVWCVVGILAALLERTRSGCGGQVQSSLYETALAWMGLHIAEFSVHGTDPRRHGSGAPTIVPYEIFTTADGCLMVGAGNDSLFGKLCVLIGRKNWIADERFYSNPARVENRIALSAKLHNIFLTRSTAEWRVRLDEAGIPNAPLRKASEVVTDEQTAALGILEVIPYTGVTTVGLPVRFDGVRSRSHKAAPRLGEDTQYVFQQNRDQEEVRDGNTHG
jgi:crotonobetainyl-CoA:carnitine CoA-transferase CaiB-like acyl-CoA transferase